MHPVHPLLESLARPEVDGRLAQPTRTRRDRRVWEVGGDVPTHPRQQQAAQELLDFSDDLVSDGIPNKLCAPPNTSMSEPRTAVVADWVLAGLWHRRSLRSSQGHNSSLLFLGGEEMY